MVYTPPPYASSLFLIFLFFILLICIFLALSLPFTTFLLIFILQVFYLYYIFPITFFAHFIKNNFFRHILFIYLLLLPSSCTYIHLFYTFGANPLVPIFIYFTLLGLIVLRFIRISTSTTIFSHTQFGGFRGSFSPRM